MREGGREEGEGGRRGRERAEDGEEQFYRSSNMQFLVVMSIERCMLLETTFLLWFILG
jgi:hypothetical protein